MSTGETSRSPRRIGILLGLLTAIGPTAIDLYLPSFTAIARDLRADPAAVQATLVSFFYALVVGQFVYGPLSDMYGRRRPLIAGLLLFLVASIVCALAPNIETLIAARFFQGIGACVGISISRAIVRDLHKGNEAADLMATISLVSGVSPVFAPMLGSSLLQLLDWRGIFWAIVIAIVMLLAMVFLLLPETHPPVRRSKAGFRAVVGTYAVLARNMRFMLLAGASAMLMGLSFAFLAGAPYVYASHFGLSPWGVGGILALNGVCQIGAAQTVPSLIRRFGPWPIIRCVSLVMLGAAAMLAVAGSGTKASFIPLLVLIPPLYMCIGFLFAPLTILVLEPLGRSAGTGSSLLGIIQLATGATVGGLVGASYDGSARPMVIAMAGCVVLASVSAWIAHARDRRRTAPLPEL